MRLRVAIQRAYMESHLKDVARGWAIRDRTQLSWDLELDKLTYPTRGFNGTYQQLMTGLVGLMDSQLDLCRLPQFQVGSQDQYSLSFFGFTGSLYAQRNMPNAFPCAVGFPTVLDHRLQNRTSANRRPLGFLGKKALGE